MTTRIEIIAVPPGEAPEDVRAAWVGMILPLARDGRHRAMMSGVLTGAKSPIGRAIAGLTGKWKQGDGYAVDARTALVLLAREHPDAARWWSEHAPHLLTPGRQFLFAADVCREVGDDGTAPAPATDPGEMSRRLRDQSLTIGAAEIGLTPSSASEVWGALMETGYPKAVATLVALGDGTTSLYFSSGGGIIGAGQNPAVRAASEAFITAASRALGDFQPATRTPYPAVGEVRFYSAPTPASSPPKRPRTTSATGGVPCHRSSTPRRTSSPPFGRTLPRTANGRTSVPPTVAAASSMK